MFLPADFFSLDLLRRRAGALERGLGMDRFGLDPLYWSHVKIFASQILQMRCFEGAPDR